MQRLLQLLRFQLLYGLQLPYQLPQPLGAIAWPLRIADMQNNRLIASTRQTAPADGPD